MANSCVSHLLFLFFFFSRLSRDSVYEIQEAIMIDCLECFFFPFSTILQPVFLSAEFAWKLISRIIVAAMCRLF